MYKRQTTHRPVFEQLKHRVKEGDTIIFDSVCRMSRNKEEGWQDYQDLYNKGVNLVFLKEPSINTDCYREAISKRVDINTDDRITQRAIEFVNDIFVILAEEQVKRAFEQAQKEVDALHHRVKEGINKARETAEEKGEEFKIGRPVGSYKESDKVKNLKQTIAEQSKSFYGQTYNGVLCKGTKKDTEILEVLDLCRNSLYKYKREIKKELM